MALQIVMGKAYKNFWSLNIDEAVVTGILRSELKEIEVLLPLNAQMKGIDLFALNLKNKKIVTIQVKCSKAYEPKVSEIKKFGYGSGGWFFLKKEIIENATSDYFIFLVYVIKEDEKVGRRLIEPHTLTIPTREIQKLCKENKSYHGDNMLSFYFWINPKKKEAFEFRDKIYDMTKYLDKKGFEKLIDFLK